MRHDPSHDVRRRRVLIGRAAQLAELTGALDRAAAGAAGTVLVSGDAGVGKTHLVTALAGAARASLGGIDALVCCVGVARLRMIADVTGEDWRGLFETNVEGPHRLLRACLPLLAPGAVVMVLSSETVHQPRTALGAYATSKAALDRLVEAWRTEHPRLRFTTVTVGATFPTDFGNEFEPELLTWALEDWSVRGLAQEEFMAPDEVAGVLAGVLGTAAAFPAVGLDHLTVRSPSPVAGTFGGALDRAAGETGPSGGTTPERGALRGSVHPG
ncbi:SDR family oxidoreductase [Actinomadura fibrosa]|uniref:SDR family oxidoreductase n=1 Tax=Actinomadura fibrosa TaxID=111802 RepID=UPI0013F15F92|nr:SDR family oxidoreductase [Actinomadura fibrosa]